MSIAPDGDRNAWPVALDMAHDKAYHTRRFLARRTLARAQQNEHRLAGCRVINMDRPEAISARMAIEK